METFLQILGGVAGVLLLYYGAEFLVKGGVSLATRMKISPLVIGLTLVAFATSAPELVVSIDASLKGSGDISIGNIVGSNICNIALILGLSAAISPLTVDKSIFKLDLPLMICSALALVGAYLLNQGVNRIEAAFFFAGILSYTIWSIYSSKMQKAKELAEGKTETPEEEMKQYGICAALFFVIAGIFGLVVGAKIFVNCAVYIAKLCNVSEAVIGLTVVAVGTSLPELATSVVAAIRGQNEIAIGNVVGSNIFNILCILGVAPLIRPIVAPGISWPDMITMLFVSLALWPLMKYGRKFGRIKGFFYLAVYAAYTIWLVVNAT